MLVPPRGSATVGCLQKASAKTNKQTIRRIFLKTLVLFLASVFATFANTVSFDTLSPFITVNNQYTVSDGVTFSSPNGTIVTVPAATWYGSSVPNAICAYSVVNICSSTLELTFTSPVTGLSFFLGAIDSIASNTSVSINGGTPFNLASAPAITAQYISTPVPAGLSWLTALSVSLNATSVSTLTFISNTDPAGLVFDNFRFTRENGGGETGVPEPGTLLLSGIGLLILGLRKR